MDEILKGGFSDLGIIPPEGWEARFRAYYEYLEEMNRVMNLTAIKGEEDVARLHFLDCAAALGAAEFSGRSVIDVGAGAGFPGIVLRLLAPDISLTLLDSQKKRVDFLAAACTRLSLTDVSCVHMRAEEAPDEQRGSFDIAVSRAVARLNVLAELCLPFVRVGGVFLAMKGPEPEEEEAEARRAVEVLGGELLPRCGYVVPGTDLRRTVLIVKKVKETPKNYPRRFAKIQKSPL